MSRPLALLLSAYLAAAALPACAADVPSPDGERELLRRVAAHYREAGTTWLEGTIEARAKTPAGEQATSAAFRVALAPGGKLRDQLDHPQIGQTRVSNGEKTWTYAASLGQFTEQIEAVPPDRAIDFAAIGSRGGMAPVLLGTLHVLDEDVESVRSLPDETVTIQGKPRRCAVVEVVHAPRQGPNAAAKVPRRFWIDRENLTVLQQVTVLSAKTQDGASMEQRETLRYTRVALGASLPDTLFAFRPPPGARKVERFAQAGVVDLTGTEAADFTLPDLAGKKHTLKSQRGRVVMLDFWASWCGPCRIQMPMVEKLHHEFKEKGLVVYAVNQGESAEKARKYLEKNRYSTTALLDQATKVGRDYQVNGIPTLVIIDREGKIAAHYVGVRTEDVLRDALRKAGL